MSDRFVVEADRRVVGVAVRAPGGFRFFSSDAAYYPLEGRIFARAKTLASSVARISRAQRRTPEAGSHLAPTLQ